MDPGLPPQQPLPARSRPDRFLLHRQLRDRPALPRQRPRPLRQLPRLLLRPPQHFQSLRPQRLPPLRRLPLLLRPHRQPLHRQLPPLLRPHRQPLHRQMSHRRPLLRRPLLRRPLLRPASNPVPVLPLRRRPRLRPVRPPQAARVALVRVRATIRSLPRRACPARGAPTAAKASVRHVPVQLVRVRATIRSLRRRACPAPELPVPPKPARAVPVPQPAPGGLVLQQVQADPVRALHVPAEPARLRA